jgi:hypothetical protein
MDPLGGGSFDLQADLWSVLPGTLSRAALLGSSSTQSYTDLGLTFYDIVFPTTFTAGLRYELDIYDPPIDPGFGFGNYDMEFFDFDAPDFGGGGRPYTVGPFTVIDGAGTGNVGGPGNSALAHFRATVAPTVVSPEPASMVLLGAGLLPLGFGGLRWRFRRKQEEAKT